MYKNISFWWIIIILALVGKWAYLATEPPLLNEDTIASLQFWQYLFSLGLVGWISATTWGVVGKEGFIELREIFMKLHIGIRAIFLLAVAIVIAGGGFR